MRLRVNRDLSKESNILQWPEDAAATYNSFFKIEVCFLSIGEYKM